MNRLLEHIRETAIPGTGVEVGLTAVKGKEPFYEKFGFSCGSSGMKKWIEIDSISERREDEADCESDAGGKTGHNAQEGDGNADLRKDEFKK